MLIWGDKETNEKILAEIGSCYRTLPVTKVSNSNVKGEDIKANRRRGSGIRGQLYLGHSR